MSTVIFSCSFFFPLSFFFFFFCPASRAPQNISLSRNFFVVVPGPLGTAADWFLLQGMPINNASCAGRRPCCCCCCCCCYLQDCCSRHTGGKKKNSCIEFLLFGACFIVPHVFVVGGLIFFNLQRLFLFLFIPARMYAARFSMGQLCGSISFFFFSFFFFFLKIHINMSTILCRPVGISYVSVCLLDLIHE